MANEFKIKKGLIVTGADGGTVVDIQGSQGQLFSVTDDLSGSIFAVSDISGVPILDVNSSGVVNIDGNLIGSSTAYFSGAITTNLSSEGTYFTGGSGSIRQLSITSGTNISANALHTFNIASSNGKYEFDVDGTTELSLDSSNATFAGDIIGGGSITIGSSGGYNAGVIYSDANWGMIFRALQADPNLADFMFANSEDVERLRITSTGATFAGDVTASNFYGLAQDLAVTSNDTFNGTYGLLWHDGADVYSSTWMTVNGSNDTLTVPTIAADLNGTINTATTGTTQTEGDNSTKIATTAYADAAAAAVPIGNYLPLAGGTMTGTIVGPTAGNSSANPPALQVVASGTGDEQASIAIQQATAEGDTIIFADYEPYVEYGISTENGNNKIQFTGGTTTGSLGSKTLYNNAGNARTAHIKLDHNLGTGDTSIGGSLTTNGVFTIQNGAPYIQWKNTSGTRLGYIQHNATNLVMSADTGEIQLNTTANSNILINPGGAGNVGIGTTSPASKLYVGSTWNTSYGGNNLYIKSDVDNTNYDPKVVTTSSIGVTIAKESATTTGPDTVGLNLYNNDGTAGGFSPMLLFSKLETPATQYKAAIAGIYARSPLGTGNSGGWIDGELIFATAGAASQGIKQRMVINKEGNVGIGTSTPNAKLDIQGTQGQLFSVTDDLSGDIFSVADISGVPIMNVNSDGTSYFDGNVGIGTESPGAKLEIKDGNLWLNGATSNYNPEIFFIDDEGPTGIAGAKIRYENNNGNLYFDHKWDTATSGFFFRNRVDGTALNTMSLVNGKVGIEMDTPQAPLSFNNVVGSKIDFYHNTSSSDRYGIEVQNSELRIHSGAQGSSTGGITFGKKTTSTFTEAMRIRNDGNVGIGTTDPGAKLDVNGTFRSTGAGAIQGRFSVGTSSSSDIDMLRAGANYITATNAAGVLHFRTVNDIRMTISNSGNVGIGTTNPGDKLEVAGFIKTTGDDGGLLIGHGSGGYGIKIGRGRIGDNIAYLDFIGSEDPTGGTYDTRFIKNAGDNGNFDINHNGTGHFSVNAVGGGDILLLNGNVGIGTTSPNAKLDVSGTVNASQGYSTNNTSRKYFWKTDNTANSGTVWKKIGTYNSVGQSSRIMITATGTTSYGAGTKPGKMTIIAQVNNNNLLEGSFWQEGMSAQYGSVGFVSNSALSHDIYYQVSSYAEYAYEAIVSDGTFTTDSTTVSTPSFTRQPERSWNVNNNLLVNSSGNVGIGTTDPGSKLEVTGDTANALLTLKSENGGDNDAFMRFYDETGGGSYSVGLDAGTEEFKIAFDWDGDSLTTGTLFKIDNSGNVTANNFILDSDERLKENIEEIENKTIDVNWKTFEMKSDKGQKRYGVVAQELEEKHPEFVRTDKEGMKSVAYTDLLIAKIAELEARLEKLEK